MNIHKSRTPAFLLPFFMLLASVANAAQAEQVIVFEDAWIAEAPPVSKVLAAYMVIKNTGDEDMKVISAQSDDFGSIEFHRTVDADGMASMQHQPFLAIPAGDSLVLEPGGYHMMLFKPARKLRAGDESGFQFKLENGKLVNVKARVKKASAEDMHQHHHHH